MARIRQFKPGFFTDDKVGRLSRDARLFFFGVLSEADDEGRLVDAPKRLAGVIYPFDEDVTPKKVERWINELVEQQIVLRYTHEGGRFLYVRKFKDHQKMSHPTPSILPPPPPGPGQSSGHPPEILGSQPGEPPEDFAPVFEGVSVSVSEGLVERVSVVEGVPGGSSSSSKLGLVGADASEEEDHRGSWEGLLVARIIAKRRMGKLTNPPPQGFRWNSYRDATVADILAKHTEDIRAQLDQGLTVEAVVDLLEPPEPTSASAPYRDPAEGEFVEQTDDAGNLLAARWVPKAVTA